MARIETETYFKPMLLKRVNEIVKRNPEPISVIGHSLGGVFARELAFDIPSHTRQVHARQPHPDEGRGGHQRAGAAPVRAFFASVPPPSS